ncbi:MAG: hypothetical protein LC789_02895 [Actinobacteria bacterium]|nr:hypothetical protein [Actinomycetota bacterium]MCA1720839.1 hypothetical protein [Actinomycetota bacterium]
MTSAWQQLRALTSLRWQMTRTPGVRTALTLLPFVVVWLLYVVTASAPGLNAPALAAALELAPAAFLGFGFLAIIAPLTAGGGNELVPSAQLVAYPVRPRTQFLGGLLLAPINLVWVVQLLVLAAETSYLTLDGARAAGALTTAAFVLCLTVLGQAMAWAVVGLRQTRTGRRTVAVIGGALMVTAVLVVRTGHGDEVMGASPTRTVVRAIAVGPGSLWLLTTLALVAGTAVGLVLGARACAWALNRPADGGSTLGATEVRRRRPQRSQLEELIAVDRASVWRASALRRGGLVLALLPSLVAIGAAVPWQSLVVLPGLVAAGAGLLFGVNAFCLDGSGALWLASLPHNPRLAARAKLSVLTETVFAGVLIAMLTGSLRSPGAPTPAEVAGIGMSGIACGTLVIATCMALSVRRPHRADLNGPRDAVAPPGALAAASARLALPAGAVGLVLEVAASTGVWWFPLLVGMPVVLGSLLWLRRTMATYQDPIVRARVMSVVAAG